MSLGRDKYNQPIFIEKFLTCYNMNTVWEIYDNLEGNKSSGQVQQDLWDSICFCYSLLLGLFLSLETNKQYIREKLYFFRSPSILWNTRKWSICIISLETRVPPVSTPWGQAVTTTCLYVGSFTLTLHICKPWWFVCLSCFMAKLFNSIWATFWP